MNVHGLLTGAFTRVIDVHISNRVRSLWCIRHAANHNFLKWSKEILGTKTNLAGAAAYVTVQIVKW